MKNYKYFYATLAAIAILALGAQVTMAASLTALSDTLGRAKKSTLSSHVIKFTTPSGATGNSQTIILTFPSDYNFTSKTIGTVTLTHGTTTGAELTETLAASADATNWGAAFSGTNNRVFTLTTPTDGSGVSGSRMEAGHKVILTFDSTNSTNPSSAANYAMGITGSFGDTGTTTVAILDDEQVALTAEVTQSITFTLSGNSAYFGPLSASAAKYASSTNTSGDTSEVQAHNIVVGTNAANGYNLTVGGQTLIHTGSSTLSISAIGGSNTASSIGTEQFGLRATATGGSGTVSSPYAASGFAFTAGTTTLATAVAATANTTYSVRYIANIASNTEAGNYATALTYVATGNF